MKIDWKERDKVTKESKKKKEQSDSRKTRKKVRKDAKIDRIWREKCEREQEKA